MEKSEVSVYQLEDTFVVCACSFTVDDIAIETGPVFLSEPSPLAPQIGNMVLKAMMASEVELPAPTDWNPIANTVPNALGLRSNGALMAKQPKFCCVCGLGDTITVVPTKRSNDGQGFDHLADLQLTLPADSSTEEVGQAIIEVLQRSV